MTSAQGAAKKYRVSFSSFFSNILCVCKDTKKNLKPQAFHPEIFLAGALCDE
jgi:hypothetical protein